MSLTMQRESETIRTFSGLRSQWMRPKPCTNESAVRTCRRGDERGARGSEGEPRCGKRTLKREGAVASSREGRVPGGRWRAREGA